MSLEPRDRVISELVRRIGELELDRPLRLAIDGATAAGKTRLADEMAALFGEERPVQRLSLDDYHRPAEARYRRGRYSPEGYYLDTFDYQALLDALQGLETTADTIIIIDGVFLLRPELNETWDYRIFVDVDAEVAYKRGIARDEAHMGGEREARRRYAERYIPGERLYLETVQPMGLADAVFQNTDPAAPRLQFRC